MPSIIKDGAIVADAWTVVRLADGENAETLTLPAGPLLVPLAVWRARASELAARKAERGEPLGVWLSAEEGPELIASELEHFSVVAVDFPKFSDGRGYSTARLLRTRYGYEGELRAIGDVLRDQLFYLHRVGFNAFAVRADKNLEQALAGFRDFSVVYQGRDDASLLRRKSAARAAA